MAAPKSQIEINSAEPEEKKESAPFKRKDESQQWAKFMKPNYEQSQSSPFFGAKPDYSHLLQKLKEHECEHHLNKDGSVTFYPAPYLSDNELGSKQLPQVSFIDSKQFKNIMAETSCSKMEASFDYGAEVVARPNDVHGFVASLEIAFFKHYPLALSPSQIWILLLQSLGMHIDQNAEKLRDKFVRHKNKKDLVVERPNFVKGSRKNKWDGVILEFVEKIDKNTVGDVVGLLDTAYSDTSLVEKIAGKVAIMDIMKHYFNFVMMCGCGFPQITLRGTKEDWVALKKKLEAVLKQKVDRQFGAKWGSAVLPVIDRFVAAFDGDIDCLFWNSMLRRGAAGGSFPGVTGRTDIERRNKELFYSGWFNVFFPLINGSGMSYHREADLADAATFDENEACEPYAESAEYVQCGLDGGAYGPKMELLPSGISAAPVQYIDVATQKQYDMKFIAGFIGCEQNAETLEVAPKIGWLIAEK